MSTFDATETHGDQAMTKTQSDVAKERRLQKKIESIRASMALPNLTRQEREILQHNLAKLMSGKGLLGHFRG
jgi:hypothetical protein